MPQAGMLEGFHSNAMHSFQACPLNPKRFLVQCKVSHSSLSWEQSSQGFGKGLLASLLFSERLFDFSIAWN